MSGDDTVYFEAGQTQASSGYRIDPDGVTVGYTYDQTTKTESITETTVTTTTVVTTEVTTTQIVQEEVSTAYDITLVFNLDATDGDGDPVSTQFLVTIDANNDGVMTSVDQTPEVQEALTDLGVAAATDEIPGGYTDDDVMVAGDGQGYSMVGGTGDDILIGGAGDDTLIGGPGDDTLTGGEGSDTFAYGEGDLDDVTAGDTNTDFELGTGGDEMELTELLETAGTYEITPDGVDSSILEVTVDLDGSGGTYDPEPLATVETTGSPDPEPTALDALQNQITPEII
jgi:Ca2+-binding RTX toxin-like protein